MECNVWLAGANDSHFGLFYCNIMGNIYPAVTSSFILHFQTAVNTLSCPQLHSPRPVGLDL